VAAKRTDPSSAAVKSTPSAPMKNVTRSHIESKTSGPSRASEAATVTSFKTCVVPFKNTDGVSCYTNSVLQSLLQHSALRNAFIASRYRALQELSNSYNNPSRREVLSSRKVRRMLGASFSVQRQQDA